MNRLLKDTDIKKSLASVIDELSNVLHPGVRISRMPDRTVVASGNSKQFLRLLSRDGNIDKTLRCMLVDACARAENMAPGCSYALVKMLETLVKCDASTVSSIAGLAPIIQACSRPVTSKSMATVVRTNVPKAADIIIEAVKLAGSECKIFVEPSMTGQTTIERLDGHVFKCRPDPMFFRGGKWVSYDVRCFIIDGLIERVSEIDAVLQRCNSGKHPMVIFARGFDRDVVSTLRMNYARRTLNVLPVTVEYNLEAANVLLDIATAVGSDVVSSLKGELISGVKFDDIPTVKSITCSGETTTITCNRSQSLETHINNLIKKRQHETLPVVKQIIDQRIRSLSSLSVSIRVDDTGSTGGQMMHEIDEGLRLVKNMLVHGVISANDSKDLSTEAKTNEIIASIIGDLSPASWPMACVQVGCSLIQALSSVRFAVSRHA